MSIGEDAEKLEPSYVADENVHNKAILENNLTISQKSKCKVTIQPKSSASRYVTLPKWKDMPTEKLVPIFSW